jgi:hypothetical protein
VLCVCDRADSATVTTVSEIIKYEGGNIITAFSLGTLLPQCTALNNSPEPRLLAPAFSLG